MADTLVNFLACGVTNAPGTAGNVIVGPGITLNGQACRTFRAADDGKSFTVTFRQGADTEAASGCVYTHSTTTLTRGTLVDSSTGGRLNLDNTAVVLGSLVASQLQGVLSVVELAPLLSTSSSAGAANATIINAAIANGGGFQITVPGVYYLTQVRVPSNTTFYLGAGVTLKKTVGFNDPMIVNTGAMLATPVRNSNIRILGLGKIDGSYTNPLLFTSVTGSVRGDAQFGIQGDISMIQVDVCEIVLSELVNCGGFGIQFQGTKGSFSVPIVDTARDFLHINGPSNDIKIDRCFGFSGDDFIALNAWDWERSGVRVGPISRVSITNVGFFGSNYGTFMGSLVRFLSGTRSTGYGQGFAPIDIVTVNGYYANPGLGSVAPVGYCFHFPGDYDQAFSTFAGVASISNVNVRSGTVVVPSPAYNAMATVNLATTTADGQNSVTMTDIVFTNCHFDCSSGTSTTPIYFQAAFAPWNLNGVKFIDCQWSPRNGTSNAQAFIAVTHKTAIKSIEVDGITINSSTSTGSMAVMAVATYSAGNPSTVESLVLSGVKTAPGFTLPGAWLLINGGIVKKLLSQKVNLTGAGLSSPDVCGINITEATSRLDNATIANSRFVDMKNMLSFSVGSTSSGPAGPVKIVFRDVDITNCGHPVIFDTSATADVVFDRSNIDTPYNLARVALAGAALTMTLRDTDSTSGGAQTITVVAGTARLRLTDKVAFSPTVVLTPANGDEVNFSGTPAYTGVNVISGTGAGRYIYRGTGTVGWIKLN